MRRCLPSPPPPLPACLWLALTFACVPLALPKEKMSVPEWEGGLLKQKPAWFASGEARAVADSVLLHQSAEGGWPKNTDLAQPPTTPGGARPPQAKGGKDFANTFDNEGTTLPLQFLARMITATGDARYRDAFDRGFAYTLAAQYPNGGWPQFYPLRQGYYSHITYNDHAMVRILTLLQAAAGGQEPFAFLTADQRARAGAAVAKGIDCILKTQVRQDGRLTAWCAQHDEKTLEPAWARAYEPPSLSGCESVGIVQFLMTLDTPAPEVIAAVEGAVAWLQSVTLRDVRVEDFRNAAGKKDRRVVPAPGAPPLWARFYELGTHRALYLDRDSVFRYDFNEIDHERRTGYAYHGTWPASLIERDHPKWRARHGLPAAVGR